ncbi:MgtC/SapB family protein [Pseudooceanicola sp. LIPI14-2-Ac024]|uniref:MgtC/SapB family protein n=1 Tax=Pseudooceanicola sp. LIPI14-2-Ac024 TaxID=3344875 RepID=UPI0035D0EAF2
MLTSLTPSEFFPSAMTHVAIAVFCGGLIGLERQLRGKSVGIRHCIIIVLTSALLVDLGQTLTDTAGDPSRVMAAIVTGVGFLGAGVIMAQGGRIQGITTATLIWALAAIGIAIALNYGVTAIAVTLIILAVMLGADWAERRFARLRGNRARRTRAGDGEG